MKAIMVITTLYPAYQNQSRREITFALHEIYKELVTEFKVIVYRPWEYHGLIFNVFKGARYKSTFKTMYDFQLNGVDIHRRPIFRIPHCSFTNHEIYRFANNVIEELEKTRFEPDIIICHLIEPALRIGEIVRDRYNSKLIVCFHKTDILNFGKNLPYLLSIKNIDGYMFRSKEIRDKMISQTMLNEKLRNEFILQSGIQESNILSKDQVIKKSHKKIQKILVAGNLDNKNKNIDIVIKAFLQLERDDLFLHIAGEGKYKKAYELLAVHNTNIRFLGQVNHDKVLEELENSEVFALVSTKETLGLVYLEAMAKGCITIGTKGEGIDGIIIDNENGYLCEPNSIKALLNTFKEILELSEFQRGEIALSAVETIRNISLEKDVQKLKDYLATII